MGIFNKLSGKEKKIRFDYHNGQFLCYCRGVDRKGVYEKRKYSKDTVVLSGKSIDDLLKICVGCSKLEDVLPVKKLTREQIEPFTQQGIVFGMVPTPVKKGELFWFYSTEYPLGVKIGAKVYLIAPREETLKRDKLEEKHPHTLYRDSDYPPEVIDFLSKGGPVITFKTKLDERARSRIEGRYEGIAQELCRLLKALPKPGSPEEGREIYRISRGREPESEVAQEIRRIGRSLNSRGGIELMRLVASRVAYLKGDVDTLEHYWSRIGSWLA